MWPCSSPPRLLHLLRFVVGAVLRRRRLRDCIALVHLVLDRLGRVLLLPRCARLTKTLASLRLHQKFRFKSNILHLDQI